MGPRLTVSFNGHDITDYLVVTEGFDRGVGTTRENDTIVVGSAHGRKYRGYRLDEKIIPMPFALIYDVSNKRRELAKIFNVSEPAPLIFSDEPDVYYMAVPTGDVNVSERNFLGIGQIDWEVPEGFAHSVKEKEFTWDGWGAEGRNLFIYSQMNIYIGGALYNQNSANNFSFSGRRITVTNDSQSLIGAKIDINSSKKIILSGVTGLSVVIVYYFQPYNSAGNKIGGQLQGSVAVNSNGYFSKAFDLKSFQDISYIILGIGRLATSNYWVEPKVEVGDKDTPWTPAPEDPVVIVSDFENKVAGNNVANPNVIRLSTGTSIFAPNHSSTREAYQSEYDKTKKLNGDSTILSSGTNLGIPQYHICWDILELVTREFPELKGISVAYLTRMITGSILGRVWAKGIGPSGNKATLGLWLKSGVWANSITNITGEIKMMQFGFSDKSHLTSDGFFYFIVFSEASNGTVDSSISIDYASIEISLKLPDGQLVTITNNGTYEVPVSFEIEHQSDNGFIGLVAPDAIIQVGNPDEIDGYNYKASEQLLYDTMLPSTLAKWTQNAGFVLQNNALQTGVISFPNDPITFSTRSRNDSFGVDNSAWHGPSIYQAFAKDSSGATGSKDWDIRAWVHFQMEGKNLQYGRQEIAVLDANKKMIAGFAFNKKWGNERLVPEFYTGTRWVWMEQNTDRWNDFIGSVIIRKEGSLFTFELNKLQAGPANTSHSFSFTNEELADSVATGFSYWNGQWADVKPISMSIYDIIIKKNFVAWEDIPNVFSQVDTVKVVSTDRKVETFRNETKELDFQDVGSQPIIVPPGETKIHVGYSKFATRPKLKATIRERY